MGFVLQPLARVSKLQESKKKKECSACFLRSTLPLQVILVARTRAGQVLMPLCCRHCLVGTQGFVFPVGEPCSAAHFLRNWKMFGRLARALAGGVVKILVIFRFISSILAMGDVSEGVLSLLKSSLDSKLLIMAATVAS